MATPKKKKPVAKKTNESRSFAKSKPSTPFLTFRFTQQTVYWLILGLLALALGIWVMYLTITVQKIYDDVDLTSTSNHSVMQTYHKK